ncbi:MAG: tRNA epoxyqueuosine(34) reductase QueG, partial [Methylophilaceae bacterium]
NGLDNITLVELFAWDEATFKAKLAGSAIYRIGYEQWLRNLAVGLGNAPSKPEIIHALKSRLDSTSPILKEHIEWALEKHHNYI